MKNKIDQTRSLQQIDFLALGLKIKSIAKKSSEHLAFLEEEITEQLAFVEKHISSVEQKTLFKFFKEEFQQQTANQMLNYEWWLIFVYRLSILVTPTKNHDLLRVGSAEVDLFIKQVIESNAWHNHNDFIRLAKVNNHPLVGLTNRFPDVIMVPTTAGDIDIFEFNKALAHNVLPLGLVSTSITADGEIFQPHRFYMHDLVHAYNWFFFKTYSKLGFKTFLDYALSLIQNERDERKKAQLNFMLFFITHELPTCIELLRCSSVIDDLKSSFDISNLLQLCLMDSWYAPLLSPYLPPEQDKTKETSLYLQEAVLLIGNYIEYFLNYFKMEYLSTQPHFNAYYTVQGLITNTHKLPLPTSMADYRAFCRDDGIENKLYLHMMVSVDASDKDYLDLSWNNMGEKEDMDGLITISLVIPQSVSTLDLSKNKLHMLSIPLLLSLEGLPNIHRVYLSHDEVSAMSRPQIGALKAIFPNIQDMLVIDDAGNVVENIALSLAVQKVQTHSQYRFFQPPNTQTEFETTTANKAANDKQNRLG